MTGGLLQLITYGAQDFLLTGIPEITFFKNVYLRYGNFSQEQIDISFKKPLFGKSNECEIPKNGDLLDNLMLKITLPEVLLNFKYTKEEEIQRLLIDNHITNTDINEQQQIITKTNELIKYLEHTNDAYINYYLVKIAPDNISSNYIVVADLLKLLNWINTTSNVTYYIPTTYEQTYLFNSTNFNIDLQSLKVQHSTDVYTVDSFEYTFTDDLNLYFFVSEVALYGDLYNNMLLYRKYLSTTTNVFLYSDTKILNELYDYLYTNIILNPEIKTYNRIELSYPKKNELKIIDLNNYSSDRLQITTEVNVEDYFTNNLQPNNIILLVNDSYQRFTTAVINSMDTTLDVNNNYTTILYCDIIDNVLTNYQNFFNTLYAIQENTTYDISTLQIDPPIYISDGVMGNYEQIILIENISGNYQITVNSDIQNLWGYFSIKQLLYIYSDNISVVDKIPIAYVRIISIIDFDGTNLKILCELPIYYITDGNELHVNEIKLIIPTIADNTTIIQLDGNIEDDAQWGYPLYGSYVYIYNTPQINTSKPINYEQISDINYIGGKTTLQLFYGDQPTDTTNIRYTTETMYLISPKRLAVSSVINKYITDGNDTHVKQIFDIITTASHEQLIVIGDITIDWGSQDNVGYYFIYNNSTITQDNLYLRTTKQSISTEYILINNVTTLVTNIYTDKTKQLASVINILQDVHNTYEFAHSQTALTQNLSNSEYQTYIYTSMNKTIKVDPLLLRNIYNALFKNNNVSYRGYVFTSTNPDNLSNIDGSGGEIGVDATKWATFTNLFYRENIATPTPVYANTVSDGVIKYIDFIDTTSTTYSRLLKTDLSSALNDTINIIQYYMLHDLCKTITFFQEHTLIYEFTIGTAIGTGDIGIYNIWDSTYATLLGTIDVTNITNPTGTTSKLIGTYETGNYNIVLVSNRIVFQSVPALNYPITSVINTYIDIDAELTSYLATTTLVTIFGSATEKVFFTNYLLLQYLVEIYKIIDVSTVVSNEFQLQKTETIMKMYHDILVTSQEIPGSYTIGNPVTGKKKMNMAAYLFYNRLQSRDGIMNELITELVATVDPTLVNIKAYLVDKGHVITGLSDDEIKALFTSDIFDNLETNYIYNDLIILFTTYLNDYYNFFNNLTDVELNVGYSTDLYNEEIESNTRIVYNKKKFDVNNVVIDNLATLNMTIIPYNATIMTIPSLTEIIGYLEEVSDVMYNTYLDYYNKNKNILKIRYVQLDASLYYSVDMDIIQQQILNVITTDGTNLKPEYATDDTTLYPNASDTVFTELNSHYTIDAQQLLLKTNFIIFNNNLNILELIEGAFETNFKGFIIKTNLINTYQNIINTSGLTGKDEINELLTDSHITLTKGNYDFYDSDYYIWYKNCIMTAEEKTSLLGPLSVIDGESTFINNVEVVIDPEHREIRTDIYNIIYGTGTNLKTIIYDILVDPNNVNKEDTELMTLIETTVANAFTNYLGHRNYYLYKQCIITQDEKDKIEDPFYIGLPPYLEYTDSTETIIKRTTDLPYGFSYDTSTRYISRYHLFNSEYDDLLNDFIFYKQYLITNGNLLKQGYDIDSSPYSLFPERYYYIDIRTLIYSEQMNVENMFHVISRKNNEIVNTLDNYKSHFMYLQNYSDDTLNQYNYYLQIFEDIIFKKYRNINIDINYTDTDYKIIPYNIISILEQPQRITHLFISTDDTRILTNLTTYLTSSYTAYSTLINLEDTITDIQNRTRTHGNSAWIRRIGHFIIDTIELKLNDQEVNFLTGDLINILYEIGKKDCTDEGYLKMIGDVPELYTINENQKDSYQLYIPIPFFFNKNRGLALPLVALQNTKIYVRVKLRSLDECMLLEQYTDFNKTPNFKMQLMATYVYLDEPERKQFAEHMHEYLIEQYQYNGGQTINSTDTNIMAPIEFHNPCKDIVWVLQKNSFISQSQSRTRQYYNYSSSLRSVPTQTLEYFRTNYSIWFSYKLEKQQTDNLIDLTYGIGENPVSTAYIKCNGQDRMLPRDGNYYNNVQPYECYNSSPTKGVNVYSFALYPLEHQPSGSFNFSFCAEPKLVLELINNYLDSGDTAQLRIYARSYNLLRIMSGIGAQSWNYV